MLLRLTGLLLLCRRIGLFDRNWEGGVLETIVHTLGVLRVSDEPSCVTTAHSRLGNVNHVLQERRLSAIVVGT